MRPSIRRKSKQLPSHNQEPHLDTGDRTLKFLEVVADLVASNALYTEIANMVCRQITGQQRKIVKDKFGKLNAGMRVLVFYIFKGNTQQREGGGW